MIVASQSENGQVLHVVPSAQPGVAQVIIPQVQLEGEFNLWHLRVCVPVTNHILHDLFLSAWFVHISFL